MSRVPPRLNRAWAWAAPLLLSTAASCPGHLANTALGAPPPEVAARPPRTADHTATSTASRAQPDHMRDGLPRAGAVIEVREIAPRAAAPGAPLRSPEPLDPADAKALLARLPVREPPPNDPASSSLRSGVSPPPPSSMHVRPVFPAARPAERAPVPEAASLEVLSVHPMGEVAHSDALVVSFSEPMVPLATLGTLEGACATLASAIGRGQRVPDGDRLAGGCSAPVELSPLPPGRWRWLGTRTLTFEPEGRFPMATEYRVRVRAGIRSADGAALRAPVESTFSTPPPSVVRFLPEEQQEVSGAEPVLLAEFDQKIDPAAVLSKIRAELSGREIRLRLATIDEVERAGLKESLHASRSVPFRAVEPIPPGSTVRITVGPGLPSKEGPRVTRERTEHIVRTLQPFALEGVRCPDAPPCHSDSPVMIEFNHPLDTAGLRPDSMRVEPPIAGLTIESSGGGLELSGALRAHMAYRVTLPGTLEDRHGQRLGEDVPVDFEVLPDAPALSQPWQPLRVLDPGEPPRFSFSSTGYRRLLVRIRSVVPEQFASFLRSLEPREEVPLPGRVVFQGAVEVHGGVDDWVATELDLGPYLDGGLGHLVVEVEGPVDARRRDVKAEKGRLVEWIERTGIGISSIATDGSVQAYVSRLADGTPFEGAAVELWPHGQSVRTASDGMARFELLERTRGKRRSRPAVLIARAGRDAALAPLGQQGDQEGSPSTLAIYAFDDRGTYRPGETVYVKGWIRRLVHGRPSLPGRGLRAVAFELKDAEGRIVKRGRTRVGNLGGFDLALQLPRPLPTGRTALRISARAGKEEDATELALQVQEFRRPEFEVRTRVSPGPYLIGGRARAVLMASYYSGAALQGAPTTWTISAHEARFVPPGWEGFRFGPLRHPSGPRSRTLYGHTDSAGEHGLDIELTGVDPPRPVRLEASVSVMDVNGQSWSDSNSLLVHSALTYVGLEVDRPRVHLDRPVTVRAIAVDLEGRALPGRPIEIDLVRLEREHRAVIEHDVARCAMTSGEEPVDCALMPAALGKHLLRARVLDSAGRASVSEIGIDVAWGRAEDAPIPASGPIAAPTRAEDMVLEVSADRTSYLPGATAALKIVAPSWPLEGLLTVEAAGHLRCRRLTVHDAVTRVQVPIEPGDAPWANVLVQLAGRPWRAASDVRSSANMAYGRAALDVDPSHGHLEVHASPVDAVLEPGHATRVHVRVADGHGAGVPGAEVTVLAVDEAVADLSKHEILDPFDSFYRRHQDLGARVEDLPWYMLSESPDFGTGHGGYSVSGILGTTVGPIPVRRDWNPVALFLASGRTDTQGEITVPLNLPDSVTRYRITAVAATEQQFGIGESEITARKPLVVRPSAPRFLNLGDTFALPVIVENQMDAPLTAEVALRATNLEIGEPGFRAEVAAHDRRELLFSGRTREPGTARFQVVASSGSLSDAAENELPVRAPASMETFAEYGELEGGVMTQPLALPRGVLPRVGGLDVSVASTQLQALTGAVVDLTSYPFECSEQIASRVIAVLTLRDVLNEFEAPGLPPPKALLGRVEKDLERLRDMQAWDGGIPFWTSDEPSWPFNTIHVAHALARAKEKHFNVDERMVHRIHGYLQQIERHYPEDYPVEARRRLTAYALYVRRLLDDRDLRRSKDLLAELGGPAHAPFEALAWLYPVLSAGGGAQGEVEEIRRVWENRLSATAGEARLEPSPDDRKYLLGSGARAEAMILDALLEDSPKDPLVPKLARGILERLASPGRSNTQEEIWAVLALDHYLRVHEASLPNFRARMWLGDALGGEVRFRGRTTVQHRFEVPMKALLATRSPLALSLDKQGPGRLYYRLGLSYAPASLDLRPADQGFTVTRRYEPVDRPDDVRREADGRWVARAGARVRVVLELFTRGRRAHVALVDPLAAGLEARPEGTALPASPSEPSADEALVGEQPDGGLDWADDVVAAVEERSNDIALDSDGAGDAPQPPSWLWYDHENVRDECVEVFVADLPAGAFVYSYIAQATTPGTFFVPPAKAEEMYAPETFGRSATDHVEVR